VLAVLLLAEGRQVPLGTLVSALWGPEMPKASVLALFLQWTAEARAARRAGNAARAAIVLRHALESWRGAPLAGIAGEYAEAQRARLTELQLAAVEERLTLDIDLGGHVAAAAELSALIAAHYASGSASC
jgi:Bacterial transcriptional activator domain